MHKKPVLTEQIDNSYDPLRVESTWYQYWEESGFFQSQFATSPDAKIKDSTQHTENKKVFSMVLPPPNVTGTLHMGHGFQHTLMDILVRYRRMCGDDVLWQCGTDHAGIATQILVERQIEAEGSSKTALGRKAFLERVWLWKKQSGDTITKQMRRLGASPDWSRERFTMDDQFSDIVIEAFVRWHDDGLIYKGKRLVNWDPVLKTALSDLEVATQEERGHLWHLRYPLKDSKDSIVVATTRPETMFGDVAIAVHPDDKRYSHLIGQCALLPLVGRELPLIADSHVDPEFGSGCVKITPAHDFNDYQIAKRHDLPIINIFNDDATLNDNTPKAYQGLDRYSARKQIIIDLEDGLLLESTQDHKLSIPRGDRSGAVLEPRLTDQWYLSVQSMSERAVAAVKNKETRFVPKHWENTYFAWFKDIQDWCISRQLWWGHQIPAWYDTAGNIYVGRNEKELRERYKLKDTVALTQDEDVLDTWFSSALWTFGTLGWGGSGGSGGQGSDEATYQRYHPTTVLITGFDIIFFWVARMMMSTLYFTDQVPFSDVYITGLVLDARGAKMSKSKGNILDPIDVIDGITLVDLIEKRTTSLMLPQHAKTIADNTRKEFPQGIKAYGVDALRFNFCALASTARDIRFDMNRMAGYRNFCNKLWNASRFVLIQTESHTITSQPATVIYDRWVLSLLQKCKSVVQQALASYRFDLAANSLHHFIWHTYCDWYLELSKLGLSKNDKQAQQSRYVLLQVLEELLRMIHPIMPYISEELWQRLRKPLQLEPESIALCSYPQVVPAYEDKAAETEMDWLMAFIEAVRNIRGEFTIPFAVKINVFVRLTATTTDPLIERIDQHRAVLISLLGLESLQYTKDSPSQSAVQQLADLELFVPMAGLVEPQQELIRLDKTIQRLNTELTALQNKLASKDFASKAPASIVEQTHARQEELQQKSIALQKSRDLVASWD